MDRTPKEIEDWISSQLSRLLGVTSHHIDSRQPLARYGLDSMIATELTADLEDWLHRPVPVTLLEDEQTIEAIARVLSPVKEVPDSSSASRASSNDDARVTREAEGRPYGDRSVGAEPDIENDRGTKWTFSDAIEPIAIVGIGCRLPGANHPEAFWHLLRNKIEALIEVPKERWDIESLYDPDPAAAGKMTSQRGGFLSQVDLFDPYFFGISPREATHMDPQQRLLLEVAWETLEQAGIAPHTLAGSQTGVFIGISTNDYSKGYFPAPNAIDAYTNTGNAHSIAASRISYVLDLHGPSIAIDTACSSSLVAIHLACQSLRSGEATLALAGGVNVMLSPEATIGFTKARMVSRDGHCRPFDAAADGLVRGEGCGMVALKRISDAAAAGNRILALIRGSAVNQDGRSKGLAAPNGLAQQAVIRQALKQAGLSADRLSYVIAQGTGTPLGDAIEIQSLEAVLREEHNGNRRCAFGSVKANIGHLEAAAGVTSIIAATLALQHEEIPPQLHFQGLNPQVVPEPACLTIPLTPEPWLRSEQPRVAGVSAFSISGTNAHVVLEEAPLLPISPQKSERSWHLLTLSAPDERALKELVLSYEQYLTSSPRDSLADICFTANTGRTPFPYRLTALTDTHEHLYSLLHGYTSGSNPTGLLTGYTLHDERPPVAFVLDGEGADLAGMGRELYESQSTFRAAIDQCAQLLEADIEQPLLSILYPPPGSHSALHESTYTQLAVFALEYALAALWRSWGIFPDAVIGYGAGAYVAAHLAGAMSLEDALMLAAERGRLMQMRGEKEGVLAVHALEARVVDLLAPFERQASVAAVHAPDRVVISGQGSIIDEIKRQCASQHVETSSVPFQYTCGAARMAGLPERFGRAAALIQNRPLALPFISTVEGEYLSPGQPLSADYWQRHFCTPVRFAEGLETLYRQGVRLFLELGASSTLCELGQQLAPEGVSWLPCLSPVQTHDWQGLLMALGSCYVHGRDIKWTAIDEGAARRVVSLPTYPFQRERYWLPVPQRAREHPLLGRRVQLEV